MKAARVRAGMRMDVQKSPVARALITPRMNWIYLIGLIVLVLVFGTLIWQAAT